MRDVFIAFNADINHHIAEYAEDKKRNEAVVCLYGRKRCRLFGDGGTHSGKAYRPGGKLRSHKVARPDKSEPRYVSGRISRAITNLSGEKVKAKIADHKQSDAEKAGTNHLALAGEENNAS